MVQTGDLILVYFVDNQPLGLRFKRHRHDWPLHITVLPWFAVPDEADLATHVSELMSHTPPCTVVVGADVLFNDHTPVRLVEDDQPLHRLQADLLSLTTDLAAEFRTLQYTGTAYRPHITHHTGQSLPPRHSQLQINTISLIRLVAGNSCEVIRHFTLQGNHL